MINKLIRSFNYKWRFLKVLFSPFKPLKLKFYWGDIAIGHPYFLPRKWVKFTEKDAIDLALEKINNPNHLDYGKSVEEIVYKYRNYNKAVPIKWFGFASNYLGWKTKFESYRFEWSPSFSFIILNKQFNITILPDVESNRYYDSYWEAWLSWEYETDKNLTIEERLLQLFELYCCTWTTYENFSKDGIKVDHYFEILKEKYHKLYRNYLKTKTSQPF